MEREYKTVDGISFNTNTPEKVCNIIAQNYNNRKSRLRFFYGDTSTGKGWLDEYDVIGYIGRSTGSIKIPLLINNVNSTGGGGILDNCIVKITKDKKTLYQHSLFTLPKIEVKDNSVLEDGKVYANCNNPKQAERLALFLKGERNSK